ncbi:MAG TPA: SGNH/GDSL hydrolase family protein [Candidatus Saccharimonadales bacterium]|nr:SGNH/GDSL hydrolase family protein [Candidatus Saccharimonadales bacterium]
MNTNPDVLTVLCYGDSNTYGQTPDRSRRYSANERWTGILQQQLGDGYYVIEEGLGGRTTDLRHVDPNKPSRNGLVYFRACIDSHMPLDIVIIMLGTNDLKTIYHRSAEDVAQSLKQYPEYLDAYCAGNGIKRPRIILVSPAYMDETAPHFTESMPRPGIYDAVSAQKSKQLAEPIKRLAQETTCEFFDAGPVTRTGDDGCHLDQPSHQRLADALAVLVRK